MPRNGRSATVLLVESEPAVALPLARALAHAGLATATAATAAEAIACARRIEPDIVLIERRLPDGDGRAVYRQLRRDCGAAVVLLTDSFAEADREDALDGADDYVVKPVRTARAVALVRAVLRRRSAAARDGAAHLSVGPLELDLLSHHAELDEHDLRLSPKELELLARLVRDAGTVVTRATLLHDVWDDDAMAHSGTLDAHIRLLRRKLGDDSHHPRFIHTVRGVGFRFASAEELAA